jgi:hypothetical protein
MGAILSRRLQRRRLFLFRLKAPRIRPFRDRTIRFASILQRRTSSWCDRQQGADLADEIWKRNQPASLNEAGEFQPSLFQKPRAVHLPKHGMRGVGG